ncbi:TetR/AcrR family transcriptional regulator [Colwellia sp. 6M3]|uniref:TetR/AcrR family transcriptional regulator n=1 Tax=Colwellia sp. 6M3 TaxID=2759849 RepID=UPI0015F4FCA5|nr:TetR/AcrR family transcriptional regulator [Colwellia sp. 6M3]MBA6417699.1 TetR/AcrR family transcriptional regulator [Colwellia sp. 6M3]
MPSTTDKILDTAMECFFQHGYDTANISMVSRHAGVSRVTIHKQFKSKEILFRAVVEKHFQKHNILIDLYRKSEKNFWQETQALIIQRCEGFFNDVSSNLVRSNLLHAGQAFCKDLIQAEEGAIKKSIRLRIEKEISANRLTLKKTGLTADDLAETLHFAPFGITVSVSEHNNIAFVENLMAVFKASTSTC